MLAGLPRAVWIGLALLLAAVWFANLDGRRLQHPDEGRYAEIAREMVATGDWLTPRLNGLKYFEKPALQYWLTAASIRAFGAREGAVRIVPALSGFLAVCAIAYAGWRLAGPAAGAYAALVLGASFWWFGLSRILTLDAALSSWLAIALAAFLLAQRDEATPSVRRRYMLAAWAAIALATLVKGLVALVIPAGALVAYTLATRDFAVWKRLSIVPGVLLLLALAAPWFILVSRANPEFARFFFIHEHFERYLTTTHRREGAWWYFVPLVIFGILPWLGVWLWTLRASWRDATAGASGFAWQRFCLAWAAFVLVFFSASGSKLPSYNLPMFPALALPLAWQLTRTAPATLFRTALPMVAITAFLALVVFVGYDAGVQRLADDLTPAYVYREAEPWLRAAFAVWTAGGVIALALFRRGTEAARSAGLAATALIAMIGLQLGFAASNAFRVTRSSADIVAALERDAEPRYDPAAPVYQVRMYDQTFPFYLRRTTTLVQYRDELDLGLTAEPSRGIARVADWKRVWRDLPQGYALMTPETYGQIAGADLPARVVARDPRRVLLARR